jgi:hypothetical protein
MASDEEWNATPCTIGRGGVSISRHPGTLPVLQQQGHVGKLLL